MGIEALLSTQIIDTTTVGRAVMTAADAAAARTAIGAGTSSFSGAYSALSGIPSTFAPSAHKTSHATGGGDALTAADIGAAATSHTHAASDIASGTIATARLASGTANSTTYLRGDQTWASVSAGITGTTGTTANRLMWTTGTEGVLSNSYSTGTYTGTIQIYDGLNGPGLRLPAGTATNAVGFEQQTGGILRLIGNYVIVASNNIQQQYYSVQELTVGATDGGCFGAGAGTNSTSRGTWYGAAGLHIMGGYYARTTASSCSVYNTYTSNTSFECLSIAWASNICTIETTKGSAGGTLRGLRIGGSSSALVGLWGATPIVQPTTAVAASTRVGGGGTTVTDSDTFDGYTLAQIVKALRNIGALA